MPNERVLTSGPGGRILTNCNCWCADDRWIVFDTRSDPTGSVFDGSNICAVNIETREVRTLYESTNGAHCGVATCHPTEPEVVFILGPERPTPEWSYGSAHREGVIVGLDPPHPVRNLDARNLVSPFTPGALRGGSHVHVWHPRGHLVSFTYDDHILTGFGQATDANEINQRNIGVSLLGHPVSVPKSHPRNLDGEAFTVLVTRTRNNPKEDTDEIRKACEEAWIGDDGYVRTDGTRQKNSLAFQGTVNAGENDVVEVFVCDLPDDLTRPGEGPLEGTSTRRPSSPYGTTQRRLTFTAHQKYPGIQGPRHWLRSSPDGSRIGFLRKDPNGVVQLFTVSPNGGDPVQVTRGEKSVESCFTWHANGKSVALIHDGSVCSVEVETGTVRRLTPKREGAAAPRPEACVYSRDGKKIAYARPMPDGENWYNQIAVVDVE